MLFGHVQHSGRLAVGTPACTRIKSGPKQPPLYRRVTGHGTQWLQPVSKHLWGGAARSRGQRGRASRGHQRRISHSGDGMRREERRASKTNTLALEPRTPN